MKCSRADCPFRCFKLFNILGKCIQKLKEMCVGHYSMYVFETDLY